MDKIPIEVFDKVLQNISSLTDLDALWRTCRGIACVCATIRSKTLWQITYRTLCNDCIYPPEYRLCSEEDEYSLERGCNVAVSSLLVPTSRPFKVRSWLYRRASLRSFGVSKEELGRCIVLRNNDLQNPYELYCAPGKLSNSHSVATYNKAREWAAIWCTFKICLVTQRVQRVNVDDPKIKQEWVSGSKKTIMYV